MALRGFSSPTTAYEMDGGSTPIQNAQKATYDLSGIKALADFNSARSAEEARIQREWQVEQNAKAMEFNRKEAEKNRNWQEFMSNTAHQREIRDLKAAGLNPVLSAMNGNGASVGSGATAAGVTSSGAKGDVDTSATSAMVNLLGTILDNQNKLQVQTMSAVNNLAVADKYTETSRIVQDMINSNQRWMAANYPTNMWSAIPALIEAISGDKPQNAISSAYDAFNDVREYNVGLTKRFGQNVFDGLDKIGDWFKEGSQMDLEYQKLSPAEKAKHKTTFKEFIGALGNIFTGKVK